MLTKVRAMRVRNLLWREWCYSANEDYAKRLYRLLSTGPAAGWALVLGSFAGLVCGVVLASASHAVMSPYESVYLKWKSILWTALAGGLATPILQVLSGASWSDWLAFGRLRSWWFALFFLSVPLAVASIAVRQGNHTEEERAAAFGLAVSSALLMYLSFRLWWALTWPRWLADDGMHLRRRYFILWFSKPSAKALEQLTNWAVTSSTGESLGWNCRFVAARVLAGSWSSTAVDFLINGPYQRDWREARVHLGATSDVVFGERERVTRDCREALVHLGAAAIPQLGLALNSESPGTRRYAAEIIGLIAAPHAVQPLAEVLDSGDQDLREKAAAALATATELVSKGRDLEVRKLAVGILGKIHHPAAVKILASVLSGGEADLRKEAALALTTMGPAALDSARELVSRAPDFEVRKLAIGILCRIANLTAIETLASVLNGDDKQLRKEAAHALTRIGHRALGAAIGLVGNGKDFEVRTLAEEVVRTLGRDGRTTISIEDEDNIIYHLMVTLGSAPPTISYEFGRQRVKATLGDALITIQSAEMRLRILDMIIPFLKYEHQGQVLIAILENDSSEDLLLFAIRNVAVTYREAMSPLRRIASSNMSSLTKEAAVKKAEQMVKEAEDERRRAMDDTCYSDYNSSGGPGYEEGTYPLLEMDFGVTKAATKVLETGIVVTGRMISVPFKVLDEVWRLFK